MNKKRGGCPGGGQGGDNNGDEPNGGEEIYIKVIKPEKVNDESLTVDSKYQITWESKNVDSVNIKYSTDGRKSWEDIAENISSKNEQENIYQWAVPGEQAEDCYIVIMATTIESVQDISGKFEIS